MTLEVSLAHAFDGFELDCDFSAPAGVTALFGRSGSGKTTVVQAVAGLLKPGRGRVRLEDRILVDTAARTFLPPHRRRIGYVFQEGRLFPHLSVRQNLEYGQRFSARKSDSGDFAHIVALLGIEDLLARRPGSLSGGEKQRVAIGRALLSSPQLLAMDEPLAALDEPRKREILPYLERVRDEAGIPILYVSHSLAEVARLATTLVVLEGGKVVAAGPSADVLSDPAMAARFGGREAGAVLRGKVIRHHEDGLSEIAIDGSTLFLPAVDAAPGSEIRTRIDAKDVMLARKMPQEISALNILKSKVISIQPGSGPGVLVQLSVGGQNLLARITKRSAAALGIEPGMTVYAVAKTVSIAPLDVGKGTA
ncbi:MAG: molybdenum ABC transporter ATP-binding protein [Nitratireductor sp.]